MRFDVVNVTDNIYEIRDGSGIGVFAPQFGPRRGFYFGLSQKIGDVGPTASLMPTKAPPSYDWSGFLSVRISSDAPTRSRMRPLRACWPVR